MTTTLDKRGAAAAARKRRWAWSTPARTIPTPYSAICGAKTTSMAAMRSVEPEHLWLSTNQVDKGLAAAATRMERGASTASAQESMAEAVWAASSWASRASWPAMIGTATAARAPPAATSKTTFGNWFAAW